MAQNIVYAIHWHQKQRNSREADELIHAESYYEAVYIFFEIAQAHGFTREDLSPYYEHDLDDLPEIDVGPSVIRLLRSDEWYISDFEETDEEDLDGLLDFILYDRLAKNVDQRQVRLIQYRYTPSLCSKD